MNFNILSSIQKRKTNKQGGAVLLAVLVVALTLVILLGVVSHALNNRLDLAQLAKQNLQDSALTYGKLNELSYLLATQRMTVAGISAGKNPQGVLRDDEGHWLLKIIGDEIRTDGFIYTQSNQLKFSIQNEAGLISINSSGQFWLKKALASYGLSLVEQVSFADILADYADSDDWRRPAGAESFDYDKAKKPTPRNYLLQNCSELWRLEIWSQWLSEHSDWLILCGTMRSERVNLNTIPITLWQKLWPASTNKISEQRQQGRWLNSINDVLMLEPNLALMPEDYYSTIGGSVFQLILSKGGNTQRLNITIGDGKNKPLVKR